MGKALEKLTPEERKRLADKLKQQARRGGAQSDPRRLDALRSAEVGLERVTADDVMKAAQTWLKDDKAWKLEIKPKTP